MSIPRDIDVEIRGSGPALFLLHGWPFHRETFRKIVPLLEDRVTCFCFNSLGMAFDGRVDRSAGLDFPHHAERLITWADRLGVSEFSILAHDTGATIARLVASQAPARVLKLILLNTEIPDHRPPFIPMYQKLVRLPGSYSVMRALMKSRRFRHSAMAFGNSFFDRSLIEGEFTRLFVDYWFEGSTRYAGLVRHLVGLDFSLVDELENVHRDISSPVMFLWGADDVTFPRDLGEAMAASMPSCDSFHAIANCAFLPQEEQPEIVANHVRAFLAD
ncbi:MAG: alpha/beta hydrolase [Pseudomonadota bacterium]